MSIAALLGVAAAGLSGYQKGKNEAEDREAERIRQEQEARLRDANIQSAQLELQRKQQDVNDQALIRSAGMNVSPESADAGPMPEGQNFRVAGQGFADAGQAQAAASAMNSPEAKTARRLGVLRTINPEQADKEEKSGMELQKYRHDFTKGMEDEGTMSFIDQNMGQAPSVEDIKAGKAGNFQLSGVDTFNKVGAVKIPAGATGKWQVLKLPNGREVADFVVNGEDGKQFYPMSARTLQAIHGMTLAEREGKADTEFKQGADIEHQRGMLGVAEKNAATNEEFRKDQIRIAGMKVAAAGVGSEPTVSLKDLREFEDEANKRVTEIFQPKEGADQNERAGLGAARNAMVAKASTLFQINATRKNPLTAGQILQALELEKDPNNVKVLTGSDGMGYRTVNVNGTQVILSQPLSRKQETSPTGPRDLTTSANELPAPRTSTAATGIPRSEAENLRINVEALRADPIWGRHVAVLDQLATGVKQANAQLAAAAKSGDPRAIQAYAGQLQTARDNLKAQAAKRLGNNATQYLKSLSDL